MAPPTAIVAAFELKFCDVTTTGTAFPEGALVGTVAFTWNKPTNPGDRPANETVADWPPIVTVTGATTADKVLPLPATAPSPGVFETAPRPEA